MGLVVTMEICHLNGVLAGSKTIMKHKVIHTTTHFLNIVQKMKVQDLKHIVFKMILLISLNLNFIV